MRILVPAGHLGVAITLLLSLGACTSFTSFTTTARPGETVALGLGWNQYIDRNNLTLTVTDAAAVQTIYFPGDPAIRAAINTYPDPLSNIIIGHETQQNIVGNEILWSTLIQGSVTAGDRDWSQKLVFVNLPTGMAPGAATITASIALDGGGTQTLQPQRIEILSGVGESAPNEFTSYESSISEGHLHSMERAEHFVVAFSGTTLPYAVQMDLTYDPDMDSNPPGTGRAYVVNTRGDIKNLHWNSDGQSMRVIMAPAHSQAIKDWNDFKFYVAGGVTGLVVVPGSTIGFDSNGIPVSGMNTPVIQ